MTDSLFSRIKRLFQPRLTPARMVKLFEQDRRNLEQQFFQKARTAGIPRGLRWTRCDWIPGIALLRDRTTSQISLLAAVNISFEAVEGGDMENVAAVGLLRDACAVFQLTSSGWQTSGRALFNMNPAEAAARLADEYEPFV